MDRYAASTICKNTEHQWLKKSILGFFALVSCMHREVKQLWHIKISQPYIARETAEVSACRNSRPKEVVYFYHGQRRQIMLVWSGLYKCKLYWRAIRPGKGLYVNAPKDHSGAVGLLRLVQFLPKKIKKKCNCFVENCGVQGEKLICCSDFMKLFERRQTEQFVALVIWVKNVLESFFNVYACQFKTQFQLTLFSLCLSWTCTLSLYHHTKAMLSE